MTNSKTFIIIYLFLFISYLQEYENSVVLGYPEMNH